MNATSGRVLVSSPRTDNAVPDWPNGSANREPRSACQVRTVFFLFSNERSIARQVEAKKTATATLVLEPTPAPWRPSPASAPAAASAPQAKLAAAAALVSQSVRKSADFNSTLAQPQVRVTTTAFIS